MAWNVFACSLDIYIVRGGAKIKSSFVFFLLYL